MDQKLFEIGLSPKQMTAFNTLQSDGIDELLYGGAKGGGKTVFGVKWVYYMVKMLIQFFGLKPSQYPPVLGFMGRKQAVDFNTTTLNTWKRDIPSDAYEIKEQKKLIVIEDTAAVQFGGLDDTETIKKFNSAEFAFYFLDQAEECDEQDIAMLRGTMRLKLNGKTPKFKGLLTANPAICWLKPAFISSPQPNTKFIQALPKDNPFLPATYTDQLKKAYSFNPALLNAYLYGSWDDLDQAFVVLPSRMVNENVNNYDWVSSFVKKITVCDVAGEGNDETVIYDMVNAKIVDQEIYSHRSLMDTVGRIQAHAMHNDSNLICVDKVSEGAGVFSRLEEIFRGNYDMRVYGFDGRISAPEGDDELTYHNYKTYAWFKAARELFAERRANVPNDQILINQLSSVTYHFKSNGKYCLDPKEKIKEKLRSSPDRADAYIMGLDALTHAKPVVGKENKKYGGAWIPHQHRVKVA